MIKKLFSNGNEGISEYKVSKVQGYVSDGENRKYVVVGVYTLYIHTYSYSNKAFLGVL